MKEITETTMKHSKISFVMLDVTIKFRISGLLCFIGLEMISKDWIGFERVGLEIILKECMLERIGLIQIGSVSYTHLTLPTILLV